MKITVNLPPIPGSAPFPELPALFSGSKSGFPSSSDKIILVAHNGEFNKKLVAFPLQGYSTKGFVSFPDESYLINQGWVPVASGHKVILES